MDQTTRKSLTQSLSKLTVEIAASLRAPMRMPGPVQEAAQALHREEQVGEAFDLWTDLLSRRAAVLWVLKSLYVRVLEDRGLLQPRRILDAEDELFRHLAPNLGPTAYLRWVYRDLASSRGGLPELFAPQPAELAVVPDALSQRLIDFWRSKNPDTGELLYRFDDEHFDSRLMGDLYQDLDPVVKKRYALLQTPDFVLDFILDETLTPAIAEWGVETVRVLDPACGSGHFLLAAFKRIVAGMQSKYPARPVREVVEDVLSRVVGIDLNDYACGLARARLVMTALETCRETDLAAAATFHPRVFWADALEQVEEDEQLGLASIADDHRSAMALLTPPEVRAALRPELKKRFHVVVGNPPYITEKDKRRSRYHTEKLGTERRYLSATGRYSLGAPFTERMLQLAFDGGFIGEITADSFMRREFGVALVQRVFARSDLRKVVCTSGAYIPGHGTPTCILFLRRRTPATRHVSVVMGRRGEPGHPADPAQGRVWSDIAAHHNDGIYDSEYISVAQLPREALTAHPWSLGGSDEGTLKQSLETDRTVLGHVAESIGFDTILRAKDLVEMDAGAYARHRVTDAALLEYPDGESVRDWKISNNVVIPVPYDRKSWSLKDISDYPGLREFLWPHRVWLRVRFVSGGTTLADVGAPYWAIPQLPKQKHFTPLSIAFAFKATHNHFALDHGGRVFNSTARIIKLPPQATEAQHLVLLAQLNSSTGEFWVKQTSHNCGYSASSGGGRTTAEPWDDFYERDGSKLEKFPLAVTADAELERLSRALDQVANERLGNSISRILATYSAAGATALRTQLNMRRSLDSEQLFRLVALQEELDWFCYKLYGLDEESDARTVDSVGALRPGQRPFEIALSQADSDLREAVARGEEPEDRPTEWFSRHGWEPQSKVDSLPDAERSIVQARCERIQASRELSLLEQPTYKRRWYRPDYAKEQQEAMELWLDDRLEAWAKERSEPFTAAQAGAALRADPGILAVGELLTGRSDFDVDALIEDRLRLAAVPNIKHHVFKPEGLLKRAEWERTWEKQHKEDRGEAASPAVPPKYGDKDYLRKEYWAQRGKLDVPKERFIAFTEVPPPTGAETLYGWAGWTPRERAKAMLGLDEQLEAAGVKVADRHGLLYGVWFLLPYVAWESADAARDFRADVKSLVGENGVTEPMLDEWAKRFPPPKGGKPAKPKAPSSETPKAKKGRRAKAKEDTAT